MVGIVVVSHSRRLADAAVELALEMVRTAPPPIEVAAGLDSHMLGTDATQVKRAIDRVASSDGVLVLMDLGSAILSAALALELRDGTDDCEVVLSEAPLVEGLVAAVTLASAGGTLAEVAAEAVQAGRTKSKILGGGTPAPTGTGDPAPADATIDLAIHHEHGLHARPVARLVETVRRFDAQVTVRNLTLDGPAVSGSSFSALSTLGALDGHQVQVAASGRQAREALAAVAALVHRRFEDTAVPGATRPPVASPTSKPMRQSELALATPNNFGGPLQSATRTHPGPFAASPGVGIGPKVTVASPNLDQIDTSTGTPEFERQRLIEALDSVRIEITSTRNHVARTAGENEAAIFDAHLMLLDDEELSGEALEAIVHSRLNAPTAWRTSVNTLAGRFAELTDPYLRARATDVRAVGDQVLSHLLGTPDISVSTLAGIVVAAELTPTQVALLDPDNVCGIVTTLGTPVSHCAILARSLGIPALVGAPNDVLAVPDGTILLIDGTEGVLLIDPDETVSDDYRRLAEGHKRHSEELLMRASELAITTDGVEIAVVANIASLEDALQSLPFGADGVGLLRTEFLFLDRIEPPSEDEQLALYLSIGEALGGRRLTARTLDAGGDKPMPFLSVPNEANPFLGLRGLRLSLCYPDFFKEQLRALLRAAQRYPITILFPMVTTIDELVTARSLLEEAATEIGLPRGELPNGLEVGAMAEVPAFALRAGPAARLVDLISIGSNDLTQYALAAERGNATVAALADSLDPAVLRLIGEIARVDDTEIAVCGELAADPVATVILIGLGVRELSMNARAIPGIKEVVRSLSTVDAKKIAELALACDSAAAVRRLLNLESRESL